MPTLQNKLHGSIKPLWLDDPGPTTGASCTCCPGPCIKGGGVCTGDRRGE